MSKMAVKTSFAHREAKIQPSCSQQHQLVNQGDNKTLDLNEDLVHL